MRSTMKRNESGMVSIFIVIFTALLVTIVSVAFVRIMIQEQEQATTNDLSKSALDSAYAGVEDAKRAIIKYKQQCSGENATSTTCVNLANAFNAQGCDTLQRVGIVGNASDKEVQVQQSADDAKLQQAYTCVKVQLDTDDYLGNISTDASRLIHLRATGAFNQVTVEWYSQKDLQAGLSNDDGTGKVDLYSGTQIPPPLPRLNTSDNNPTMLWPKNRPALLRVQLLQVAKSFKLSDFDKNDDDKRDDASLFLYPANFGDTTASFSNDSRLSSATGSFRVVKCDETFSTTAGQGAYACKLTITIPNPVGVDNAEDRDVYLRVSELYNISTTFRVTLQDGTNKATFKAVQPVVDSTGRANDLFRRISSRVDLEGSSIPGLEAAVDISGNLCKNFLVTDDATDFHDNCSNLAASAPPKP